MIIASTTCTCTCKCTNYLYIIDTIQCTCACTVRLHQDRELALPAVLAVGGCCSKGVGCADGGRAQRGWRGYGAGETQRMD